VPEPHNHARDYSLSTDGLSKSRWNCPCTCILSSPSIFLIIVMDLSWFLISWAAAFCVLYLRFTRLDSFCREFLVFPASHSYTNMVTLSLPTIMHSLRPMIAALRADSSSTNGRPPICLSIQSLLAPAFVWWVPSSSLLLLLLLLRGTGKSNALKVSRQCPLVLMVKVKRMACNRCSRGQSGAWG